MPVRCVAFDCDGVLVDAVSSWRTLHEHFGTDNHEMLARFIAGELEDKEFMISDIELWKGVQPRIHRDDLFKAFAGATLMDGARDVVAELKNRGVFVVIVSAGVDLFVSAIASMLKVDDWIANGFHYDDDGWLLNDGDMRVSAHGKDDIIQRILEMNGFAPEELVCVGDSEVDVSMMVEGARFIGFNPSRESSELAFAAAGVDVVRDKDLRSIWRFIFQGEEFPEGS